MIWRKHFCTIFEPPVVPIFYSGMQTQSLEAVCRLTLPSQLRTPNVQSKIPVMHSIAFNHGSCYHSAVSRLPLEKRDFANILGMSIALVSASVHLQGCQRFNITFAVVGGATAPASVINFTISVPCGHSTMSGTESQRSRCFVPRRISTITTRNLLI